jgi:predicted metalloprotease with PDZ domain
MSMQAPFVDAAVSIDAQNRANTFISYYTWGAAIGLGLDFTLRTRFPGVTLDDYMRAMWEKHGEPGIPYTLDDLRTVLGAVTKDPAFADDFFRRYINGRDVVDYRALLANAGFLVRPARAGAAWTGPLFLRFQGGNAVVASNTLVGTPVYEAGIDRDDRIVSIGGQTPTSMDQLASLVAARKPGETIDVVVESRGRRRTATVKLAEDPTLEVVTYEAAGMPLTPAMRTFRTNWLSSKATTVR